MKKAIHEINGTVGNVINNHMNEIDFNASLESLKNQIISIISSPEVTRKADAQKFIFDIRNMRNKNQLISTIGTYITAIRVS